VSVITPFFISDVSPSGDLSDRFDMTLQHQNMPFGRASKPAVNKSASQKSDGNYTSAQKNHLNAFLSQQHKNLPKGMTSDSLNASLKHGSERHHVWDEPTAFLKSAKDHFIRHNSGSGWAIGALKGKIPFLKKIARELSDARGDRSPQLSPVVSAGDAAFDPNTPDAALPAAESYAMKEGLDRSPVASSASQEAPDEADGLSSAGVLSGLASGARTEEAPGLTEVDAVGIDPSGGDSNFGVNAIEEVSVIKPLNGSAELPETLDIKGDIAVGKGGISDDSARLATTDAIVADPEITGTVAQADSDGEGADEKLVADQLANGEHTAKSLATLSDALDIKNDIPVEQTGIADEPTVTGTVAQADKDGEEADIKLVADQQENGEEAAKSFAALADDPESLDDDSIAENAQDGMALEDERQSG
jgi:hypothetical protein